MFTHQPAGGEPLSASLDAGNEEEVRPRLTVVFQVKSKGRGDYYGGTNTSVIFHPAKHSSKLKAVRAVCKHKLSNNSFKLLHIDSFGNCATLPRLNCSHKVLCAQTKKCVC